MTHAPPRVRLFDAAAEAARDGGELISAAASVISSGRYILGPQVDGFEQEVAAYLGGDTIAVSCASGTDALWLAIRALGIGDGDHVVVPAFTFFATASAVLTTGATPVVCDVDPQTLTLDPEALERIFSGRSDAHERLGIDPGRIKAVIPVHLFGQPADMDALERVSAGADVRMIEDAAQAFGAVFGDRKVGTLGAAGCFSFFPTKNLGGFGDGGLVTTGDPRIADELRALRAHGARRRYVHDTVGTNSRLDALQAAMLGVRLRTIDDRLADRRALADRYDAALCTGHLGTPVRAPGRTHTFNLYVVRVDHGRDRCGRALGDRGIETAVHYPSPLHLQRAVAHLGYREGDFPVAEEACRSVLTIPLYPSLDPASVDDVARNLQDVVGSLPSDL